MDAISLLELNRRVAALFATAVNLQGVWVTAETADLRVSGGHCYFELVQKNPDKGTPLARCRAVIWASDFARINACFRAATGAALQSGIKIMARVSVSFHAVYGLSMVVTDVNPDYTVGDLLRRRNEMVARLKAEGIIDMNRTLPWPSPVQRVAVISAAGAAGYGDFLHQLYTNPYRLRFVTKLFPATMQGETAAGSVLSALGRVASAEDEFDCVVIIRGGGAGTDLASFDDYELAANIAQFPLPVIVGIGHERDVTLLDYVANMRVKTPTAAAEWLIGRGVDCLRRLHQLGSSILQSVTDRIGGNRRQLAYITGQLPALARLVVERNRDKLGRRVEAEIVQSVMTQLRSRCDRLDAIAALVETLSPQCTLRRGYSITRVNGRAVTDASAVPPGTQVETILDKGSLISTVDISDK